MAQVSDLALFHYTDAEHLGEELDGADALFVWDFLSTAVEAAWGEDSGARKNVRWVHIAAAGVDTVMFPALRRCETVVTNSRGIFDQAIAEFVLGTVLAFAKGLPENLRLQSRRQWQHRETERLAGSRALIVGTGSIGRSIARLLAPLDVRVSGIGRTGRDADPDFGSVHSSRDLVRYLPEADFVVSVTPLTETTRGMFDAAAFAAMKPTARLVNVGRGATVVTEDLIDALQRGAIAGAALDVAETEPLPPESALWSMPGTLISPHMAGDVAGWRDDLSELFRENLRRWVDGSPLRNAVDKARGY
jgi:phosphoglycerate dehydrogenase-like enzyme